MMIKRACALAAGVAAAGLLVAGCGGGSAPPAHTAAAKPKTCAQQYSAWRNGQHAAKFTAFTAALKSVTEQANAEDFPGITAALEKAGKIAGELAATPPPKCADPAGYFGKMLARVEAAGDNARAASGLTRADGGAGTAGVSQGAPE